MNDQVLARRMLLLRENDFSIAHVLQRSVKVNAILLVGLSSAIAGCFIATTWTERSFWTGAAGFVLGAILRDVTWLRAIRRQWPFTKKITDWETVELLASQTSN